MSVQETNLTAIANAIREKEGSTGAIPANTFAQRILGIQTGVLLPELTNPGTAADLLKDKQLIDANGNLLTGTYEGESVIVKSPEGVTIELARAESGYLPVNLFFPGITDHTKLIAFSFGSFGLYDADSDGDTDTALYFMGTLDNTWICGNSWVSSGSEMTIQSDNDGTTIMYKFAHSFISGIFRINTATTLSNDQFGFILIKE